MSEGLAASTQLLLLPSGLLWLTFHSSVKTSVQVSSSIIDVPASSASARCGKAAVSAYVLCRPTTLLWDSGSEPVSAEAGATVAASASAAAARVAAPDAIRQS